MIPTYAKNTSELGHQLSRMAADDDVQSVLLMGADDGHPAKEELDPLLNTFLKPLIGGIFPEIIADNKRMKTGFLLFPLSFQLRTKIVELNCDDSDCIELLKNEYDEDELKRAKSLFVFVDAFGHKKKSFVHSLFNFFGNTVKYLGGGAGSLSFEPFECILHNSGAYQNAAVLGLCEQPLSLGVAHGWTPIGKPLKVTKAEGNTIISLEWTPAFKTYKEQIERHSGLRIKEENFFAIAKSYPLGMVKLDSEMVIRDPYRAESGVLYIVDEVPEGEYVRIMNGNIGSLLSGAGAALEEARQYATEMHQTSMLCIDCISRVLYMQDDFTREINVISGQQPVNGALSIGEIANAGETFLEVYNKTIVIALWQMKT
jgi:hypothetical protein